ncbi:DUF1793-domain-containing protein [Ganoderma leucocontextum]|nr:DUF1793-domain-containing protein [Ganoderma leucocontextum]
MRLFAATSFLSYAVTALGAVTWSVDPFNPAAVPLAVRSPYLSAWLPQGAGTALSDAWPTFWTGSVLGWAGLAKVDGQAYVWMGTPGIPNVNVTKATQKTLQFTSTQSVFVMTAGPVDLTITFLSPVEPSDFVNQSLPLSYYSVSAASNDGKSHTVQVYADISAEWVSGDNSLIANWATTTGGVLTHEVTLANPSAYTEISDRIQQGSAFHSTLNTAGATYQTGEDVVVRAQFAANGTLANTQDTAFRAISDRWPVFAFAHDLGAVTSATVPVVYSIGHVRDPVVQYVILNGGVQARSSYFWTRFSTIGDAISTFLNDYANALARGKAFDAQVNTDASKISADYASVVALSIRQAFGATEITVSKNTDGSFDTSNTLMFMKEISSDGNVNTVDVIYPTWPLFVYTNATLGKQLLLPLFAYQATGQYPNQFSVHDMGAHYPNATGHNDGKDEHMPVEESGNMLIMTLSYTQQTGDMSLIKTYFSLLDQWTQFLIADSLIPENQLSTDDFAGSLANQTNLAIKGIIGIQAMAEIAQLNGDEARASNYSSIAASYVQQWQKLAASADGSHLTLSYGDSNSWGLAYNLYADKLLGTNLFPSSVYDMQTAWYASKDNAFGVPLDTRHTFTKSDWQLWTAGTMTSTTVRDQFVQAVRNYASDGKNSQPLGDLYQTTDGTQVASSFHARPVVGGHLALLALAKAPTGTTITGSTGSTSPTSASGANSTVNTNKLNPANSGLSHRRSADAMVYVWLCTIGATVLAGVSL